MLLLPLSCHNRRKRGRGVPGSAGFRGPPQHSFRPSQGQGSSASFIPKRQPYDTGYRDSIRQYPHYTQPKTEPDIEELLRRLEQKVDDRLLEKVMERMEAESNAIEKATKADAAEPKVAEAADDVPPKPGESIALETQQEAGGTEAKSNEVEQVKTEPVEKAPSGIASEPAVGIDVPELEDALDAGELDWLGEELGGLTVEVTDMDAEMEIPSLELLDNVAPDMAKGVAPPEPTGLVAPELEPVKNLEPMLDMVDPLKPLEPGIAELREEADEEVEPV